MAERPKTYKKKLTEGEKLIKLAKDRYKRARDIQSRENTRYSHNIKFTYDADSQWPEAIKKQRELDMRPVISVNRQPVFARSIINQYKQNPSAIKVMPVDDGADKEVAEIYTGLIRNIEQQSNAAQVKGNALNCAVAGNKGFFRVITEYEDGAFTQSIKIVPVVNPLTVTYDCDDKSLDGSGWNWCFVEDTLSQEEFEDRYPEEDMLGWSSDLGDGWVGDKGNKIRIAEYFYKEMVEVELCLLDTGEVVYAEDLQEGMNVVETRKAQEPRVKWCILGGNAKEPLERKEWAGKYIPVIPVWGDQQWIDGERVLYSALEASQDSQRMVNFWRSTETELLSLQSKAPFMLTAAQVDGYENEWIQANSTNKPYLLYNSDPTAPAPMRQGFAAPPSGVLAGAANAAQDLMDTTGIQEAGLGMQSNETSGRAINARATQSQNSVFHFLDNMHHADRLCGVILVDLIPRVYDYPAVVRTLGIDGTEEMKKVNQAVEEKDEWGQAITKVYDLGVGKYDVVIASGPSFNTKRQESAELMAQIAQGNPEIMAKAGDLLIKALDIPGADEISERLKKFMPPEIVPKEGGENMPPEVAMQMQQMQQQMQQMDAMLQQQAQELQSKQAEYAIKQQELQIKQFDAETKRMQALQPATPPVQVEATVEPELSEADKLEIDVAKTIRIEEMRQEHAKEMEILRARIAKMQNGEMHEIGEDGEPMPSELALGLKSILDTQSAIAEQQKILADQIAGLAQISAAPKRLIRDENGNIVGSEVVI